MDIALYWALPKFCCAVARLPSPELEEKNLKEQEEVMKKLLQDLADAEASLAKAQRELQLVTMAAASAGNRSATLEEELATATQANKDLQDKLEAERSAVRKRNLAIHAWRARVMALQEEMSDLQAAGFSANFTWVGYLWLRISDNSFLSLILKLE